MNTPRSTSTSTPTRPAGPTPAGLPHSQSLPTIPTITTPRRQPSTPSSTDHLRSPQTPASSSKNKNFHPYLIQTTTSSLLSRTNSSPVQPVYEGGPKHRVSRSMSALNKMEMMPQQRGRADSSDSDAGSEDRTPGKGSPDVRKGMRRSGTLPSFPSVEDMRAKSKAAELPAEPKEWTPSELGRYLEQTLKGGGVDGTGPLLPAPLIEDIKTWVLRHQVSGRAFLKGPESWTTATRPPPFLPLLTSISRRLRRASIQSRISLSKGRAEGMEHDLGPPSVLLEEDGDEPLPDEEEMDRPMTGVRKMANAFDAIYSSASEASGDEAPLKPQWTGESQRREGWKRWEADMKPLRRHNTGSSMGSIDEIQVPSHDSPRRSVLFPTGRGDDKVVVRPAEQEDEHEEEDEEEEDPGVGTIKARPGPMEAGPSSASSNGTSPPPPYASPDPNAEESATPSKSDTSHSATPIAGSPACRTPSSRVDSRSSAADAFSPASARSTTRQSLGRSASRRLPKVEDTGVETDDEGDPSRTASGRYSTARRVTIRPAKPRVTSIFEQAPATVSANDSNAKSPRELDVEKQVADMHQRLQELESRLESVDKAISHPAPSNLPESSKLTTYLLGRLGLARGVDGLPQSVGELPAYLFLVGFGVGAVVVRVLFSRR